MIWKKRESALNNVQVTVENAKLINQFVRALSAE